MVNYEDEYEELSNCCGASVIYESGICSECKEHCEIEEPEGLTPDEMNDELRSLGF